MLVNGMADIQMSRAGDEDVDQAIRMVNERVKMIDCAQAETVYERVQVEMVDECSLDTVEMRAKQMMSEQGKWPIYADRIIQYYASGQPTRHRCST